MTDINSIDNIINMAMLTFAAAGAGIAMTSTAIGKIKDYRDRGDSYLLLDKRLTGGREMRIYHKPLKYVRLRIPTSYKEPEEPL